MNIKKFLAITLCMAFIISMTVMPTSADDTEFTPTFLGIGSEGIAYDDITLPKTTSAGDEITWSEDCDTLEIVEDTEGNKIAKIVKYDADKNLDATVTATVDGTPNTINFKVAYLYAEKTEIYPQDFNNYTDTLPNSTFKWRDGVKGSDTMSIENGRLKIYRPSANTGNLDFIKAAVSSKKNTTNSHILEFDIAYENTIGLIIMRFPGSSTSATPVELKFNYKGQITATTTSKKVSVDVGELPIETSGEDKTIYGGKITIVVDRETSTYDVLINGNLAKSDLAFYSSTYTYQENMRVYAESDTGVGSIWLDNIKMYTWTDAFEGLDKATLNAEAGAAGTDTNLVTTGLTLPESVTAGNVAWVGSGSLDNSGKPVNQSFFEEKTGTVTATVTGTDSTTYTKSFAFNVAKVEFAESTSAKVTKTGNSVTAKIENLNVAGENLTVILAAYNKSGEINELADVKLTKQQVANDGTLTVTIKDLSSDVTDASFYKMFVFDSETSLTPLTTVTVE